MTYDVTPSGSFLKRPTEIRLSPHWECASNPFDLGVSLSVSEMHALKLTRKDPKFRISLKKRFLK